jgi:hypothetical protein
MNTSIRMQIKHTREAVTGPRRLIASTLAGVYGAVRCECGAGEAHR